LDAIKQFVLVLNSRSSSGDRPDPGRFLEELFSGPDIARGSTRCEAGSPADRPQPAGTPDEAMGTFVPLSREDLLDELRESLLAAAERGSGGVLRRIAEIVEQVIDEPAACVWWLHAAQAGDEVAEAIVDELALDVSAERPSVLRSVEQVRSLLTL
jgi:hypothetical protein